MPSIGAATAFIVAKRIDDKIEATFDEKTRKDVYRFLNLSSKGGDMTYVIFISVFGPLLTVVASFATSVDGLIAAIIMGTISLSALDWAVWRRNKARRELDALVASNREYWLPIADKLEQIVLSAGKFKDGLPPLQATRIVR